MPGELEEEARIDGCTQGQAFRTVILPLAAPAVFTTAILAFISAWNEFLIASRFSNSATQTVTVAIASFAGSQAPGGALHGGHGRRNNRRRSPGHFGAGIPAQDRVGPDRGRGQVMAARAPSRTRHEPRAPQPAHG